MEHLTSEMESNVKETTLRNTKNSLAKLCKYLIIQYVLTRKMSHFSYQKKKTSRIILVFKWLNVKVITAKKTQIK